MPYVGNPKWMTQHQKGQQGRGHGLVAGWNNGTIKRRAREPAPPVPPRRMCTRSGTRQNRDGREARNQRRSRTRSRTPTSTRRDTTGNSGSVRGGVVPANPASDDMPPAPVRSQHSVGEQSGRSSAPQVAGTSAHGQPSNHGLLRTPPRRRSEDRSNGRGVPDTHYDTGPAPIQLSNNRTSLTTDGLMIATAPQMITDSVIVEIEKNSEGEVGFKLQVIESRCFVSMVVQSGFDADGKLQIGDRILSIGGRTVTDRESVQKAIADAGEYVEMTISREYTDTTF